jgi:hypothetical protein
MFRRHAFPMTRDEIRLMVFVLLTIALGLSVKWWRDGGAGQPQSARVVERKSGWADPPYVFKSRAVMEKIRKEGEREPMTPKTEAGSEPAKNR